MKTKLIAALTIATLLFIVIGSTALADNAWCDTCNKNREIIYVGWEDVGYGYHKQIANCYNCGSRIGGGMLELHTGGTATCNKKAVCSVCNAEYGSLADFHRMVQHEAKTVTCTESGWDVYFVCRDCGYSTKKEIGPLEHDYGPWVLNNNGTHTHTCNRDKNHTETENCGGGTASCNARAVCEKCGAQYGEKDPNHHDLVPHEAKDATCTEVGWDAYDTCSNCNYTTYDELAALSHDYKERVFAPTCEKAGYTLHNCSRCDDRYMTDRVAKRGHWYGEWAPVEESAHEAVCLRKGCGGTASVDCEIIACMLTPDGQEEPLALSLCPVCGRIEGGESLLLKNVTAAALKGSLPAGEVFARLFTLKNGEKLLAVGFERGGRLVKADCPVRITLPVEAVAGYSFSLIDSDGMETEAAFEGKDEEAFFSMDFTEDEIPVILIRMTDA